MGFDERAGDRIKNSVERAETEKERAEKWKGASQLKYKFNGINSEELYKTGLVVFITGPYELFNNMVSDKFREKCKPQKMSKQDVAKYAEWGLEVGTDDATSNSVDLETFLSVVDIPSINGKWYSLVEYSLLNDKQRERINQYIKRPNKNGILNIVIREYKEYARLLRDRLIEASREVHLIQLSFPNRRGLIGIANNMFKERGVIVADKALELFVTRLGSDYDAYANIIDQITLNRNGKAIKYEEMSVELKGIVKSDIDKFLEALTHGVNTCKITNNRMVYKMLDSLLGDLGARLLVNKLISRISVIEEMRIIINEGYIPINVMYSVDEVKEKLGEHKLTKLSNYTFRKTAELASLTSLKDWVYMKLILMNVTKYNDCGYERSLYAVIHRGVNGKNLLNVDIGASEILEGELYSLNRLNYN